VTWSKIVVSLVFLVCVVFASVVPVVARAKPSEHAFEIVPGSFQFAPSNDSAGAHANWVLAFDFAHEGNGTTYNDVRTIVNEFPAGFDASNTAVPTCSEAQLLSINAVAPSGLLPNCPVASQIGEVSTEVFVSGTTPAQVSFPIYNVEVNTFGTTAEAGYNVVGLYSLISQVHVRPGDEGITAITSNIPKQGEAHNISVTLWGIPAAHEHDAQRGAICGANGEHPPICRNEFGGPQEARIPAKPFLSNPTSCGSFKAMMEAYSWEEPEKPSHAEVDVGPIKECDHIPFEPSIEVQPSTRSAESPTGLEVSLVVPQSWENQFTISTSNLKDAKVSLPEGMTANPSLAAGLGACTPAEYEAETSSSLPGEGCPQESKIGSIEIETPLLAERIPGAIYIAKPYDNPFGEPGHPNGTLLALYIVAKDPERGIIIKVAGKIEPNPVTGQLVTTFLNNPQQPFSKFTLKFRPGATAPLATPPGCGEYSTQAVLTPWSAPLEPRLLNSHPFALTQGVHEGACPSGGVPPLKPQVISGTNNNAGGSYSPFYLRIVREDGEQELTKFSTSLPPGLTGNLSGVPFCPEAAIEAARRATGAEELAHPACPAASEIGHTLVGAGVGPVLAQTPGKIYLAGPYHGAPLSIVSVTSATVGPFDLGTVVIRFALRINLTTAQVEVDSSGSDPIPHIIDGIVVHVRDIRAYVNRPSFILNPTNCAPMGISDTITGAGANYANPADQVPVTVLTPFEAADCAGLAFKPSFKVSTSGRTSRVKGASLSVKLTYPKAAQGTQSNIRSVKVDLPKQLPSRLSTLQKACLDSTFNANPAACPAASRVGQARAITPILPVPLEGPAYFVSHGGAKFPELIIVLQGYGITIDLHGETFISKAGITSSTFRTVPDQPVESFELTLPQGRDSALAANGNLCSLTRTITQRKKITINDHGHHRTVTRTVHKSLPGKLQMPTVFTAQNGAVIHQNTSITITGCTKHKTATKKGKTK
jgi:hypothetical protein